MAARTNSEDTIASLMKELYFEDGYLPLAVFANFLDCAPKEASKWISENSNFFKVFNTDDRADYILGITKLTFCKKHASKPGSCFGCDCLHMCKFYVLGDSCKFGANCNFNHDFFENNHNKPLLQKYHLQQLNPEELKCLFQKLENRCDVTTPTICKYFNAKRCEKKDCVCLHICQHYLMNECRFGKKCRINHDFDEGIYQILKMYGILFNSVSDARSKLKKLYTVQSNSKEIEKSKPVSEINCPNEDKVICLYNLSFLCTFKDTCRNLHKEMPYQWQYKSNEDNGEWQNFSEWNELIELKFCNLENKTDITDAKQR